MIAFIEWSTRVELNGMGAKKKTNRLRESLTENGVRIVNHAGRPKGDKSRMKPDLLILQEVCVRLLKAGNCSQSAFSQKFDVDINIIRQACAGTNAPNPVGAQKLLNALFVYTDGVFKLTVEEFLDITNPEFREIPYRSEARDKTGTVQKVWELVEQSERSLTPLELGPDK